MRHSAVVALIRAAHPAPCAVVAAVAGGLAALTGRAPGGVLLVVTAVLAGQLSVGWLNDLVDAERDAAADRSGKPLAAGEIPAGSVRVAIGCAAAAAVLLSLPSGLPAAVAHTAALVSAWYYDLDGKSRPWSVLPYAVSFGLLPVFVLWGGARPVPWWLVLAAVLLGSAAHFANALPDLRDDLAAGVRGLPHRLGRPGSTAAAAVLVLAASAVLVLAPGRVTPASWTMLALTALVLVAGGLLARRSGSRAAFHAVLVVAVLDVLLLLARGG
ncbi:UbiA family prenyltransferase [Saccharopolyspora sp. HNM0983]|uniref:UbiA family prenyltransferase n=1 Tax=Saccharopolyspora montiporae TaxID=2781240 RepID=A0A929BDC5_9PSEU|nr:UbiA family prenyltransferase [Saccharopolyspora sp. HNM0983]MBE9375971.1 UbiA family prenyltransferase [Saccharopolyspora sp. HNM0983]